MESERIEQQYLDAKELTDYLTKNGEISFSTYIDDVYKKVLVLSAASYFETKISTIISEYVTKASNSDPKIINLVKLKVLDRQYHTFFDWKTTNTNMFWKLFGEEMKTDIRKKIDKDESAKIQEKAFMDLGGRRNLLVHENFAEFNMTITLSEIYEKYKQACGFVSFIHDVLLPNKSD
ncbi:MAG: hypothetical protein EOM50_24065 [Erysipelotrichia bacterium]|nr:hypothetical protein [Erysipelotrichia bacterium]